MAPYRVKKIEIKTRNCKVLFINLKPPGKIIRDYYVPTPLEISIMTNFD